MNDRVQIDLRKFSRVALIDKCLELQDQLQRANTTILQAEHVCNWLLTILASWDHRALSAVRRLFRMKPEIPPDAFESLRKSMRSSAVHPK